MDIRQPDGAIPVIAVAVGHASWSVALKRARSEPPQRYVFVSECLAPLSVAGYLRMVARAGDAAGFPSLSTATCFATAPGTTVRYTALATRSVQGVPEGLEPASPAPTVPAAAENEQNQDHDDD